MTPRRYNKGDRIVLSLHTLDSSDVSAWADAAITAKIYDGSGNLDKTVYLSPTDKFRHTGLMRAVFLNDLDAGHYTVVMQWAESTNNRIFFDGFEVLNVGDTEGGVTELYDFLGPGPANGLIYQTETGKIYFGRNPR